MGRRRAGHRAGDFIDPATGFSQAVGGTRVRTRDGPDFGDRWGNPGDSLESQADQVYAGLAAAPRGGRRLAGGSAEGRDLPARLQPGRLRGGRCGAQGARLPRCHGPGGDPARHPVALRGRRAASRSRASRWSTERSVPAADRRFPVDGDAGPGWASCCPPGPAGRGAARPRCRPSAVPAGRRAGGRGAGRPWKGLPPAARVGRGCASEAEQSGQLDDEGPVLEERRGPGRGLRCRGCRCRRRRARCRAGTPSATAGSCPATSCSSCTG